MRRAHPQLAIARAGALALAALAVTAAAPAPREFEAVFGEPEFARVTFDERAAGVLVTFDDEGAPTGPPAGRYRLYVAAGTSCDYDARPGPYNPHHAADAPGVLPPVAIVDGPGPDGGTVGTTHYAHVVRGLEMRGRNSIEGHALILITPGSTDEECATIDG